MNLAIRLQLVPYAIELRLASYPDFRKINISNAGRDSSLIFSGPGVWFPFRKVGCLVSVCFRFSQKSRVSGFRPVVFVLAFR
jgi:hypothetical protein